MDHESDFRAWLIAKLKQTRWISAKSEERAAVAKRLLVAPEALDLAQQALDEDQRRAGRAPVILGTGARKMRPRTLEVAAPKLVYEDWRALCAQRRIPQCVLLRSLVQALLSSAKDPPGVQGSNEWRYRGEVVRIGVDAFIRAGKYWPYRIRTTVSHGAARALSTRARRNGVTMNAFLRAQILGLLEGRIRRLDLVQSPQQMWDDENRYCT